MLKKSISIVFGGFIVWKVVSLAVEVTDASFILSSSNEALVTEKDVVRVRGDDYRNNTRKGLDELNQCTDLVFEKVLDCLESSPRSLAALACVSRYTSERTSGCWRSWRRSFLWHSARFTVLHSPMKRGWKERVIGMKVVKKLPGRLSWFRRVNQCIRGGGEEEQNAVEVVLPPGTFTLKSPLRIGSSIHLLSYFSLITDKIGSIDSDVDEEVNESETKLCFIGPAVRRAAATIGTGLDLAAVCVFGHGRVCLEGLAVVVDAPAFAVSVTQQTASSSCSLVHCRLSGSARATGAPRRTPQFSGIRLHSKGRLTVAETQIVGPFNVGVHISRCTRGTLLRRLVVQEATTSLSQVATADPLVIDGCTFHSGLQCMLDFNSVESGLGLGPSDVDDSHGSLFEIHDSFIGSSVVLQGCWGLFNRCTFEDICLLAFQSNIRFQKCSFKKSAVNNDSTVMNVLMNGLYRFFQCENQENSNVLPFFVGKQSQVYIEERFERLKLFLGESFVSLKGMTTSSECIFVGQHKGLLQITEKRSVAAGPKILYSNTCLKENKFLTYM